MCVKMVFLGGVNVCSRRARDKASSELVHDTCIDKYIVHSFDSTHKIQFKNNFTWLAKLGART